MRDACSREEEDAEKHKGQVPRVNGVGDAGEGCGDEATGRERVLGIGAVDHQP